MNKAGNKAEIGSKSEKKAIIVTGTPGTGKSKIARELSLYLKRKLISTTEMAKTNGLFEKYDRRRATYIVDMKRLNRILIKEIEDNPSKSLIIEGHMSHFLPNKYVESCIVCKTGLKELKKRLEMRRYSSIKIRENLDCEIFDVCLDESIQMGHKIYVFETDGSFAKNKQKLRVFLKKYKF